MPKGIYKRTPDMMTGKYPRKIISIEDRFWEKVKKTSTCWIWTACKNKGGYGVLKSYRPRRSIRAHRLSYEIHKGKIPKGLTLDHICRVRHCVNPDHLEAVTMRENLMRGNNFVAVRERNKNGIS